MKRKSENAFWVGICFLAGLSVLISLAEANPLDDCNSNDMQKRIVGCSELLKGADLRAEDRALALSLRSEAHAKQNSFDQAIDDLEQARKLQPNDDAYKERLAWARALRSDERIAKNELPGAIEDLAEAMNFAQEPAPLRSRLVKLYEVLGRQLQEAGDHKGAADIYSKAIEIEPKRSDLFALRAESKVASEDVDGGISDYTEATALTPESTELHMRRGDLLLKREMTTQAIQDFDFVLKAEPKNIAALLLRANALESAGADKRDDAKKAYEAALVVDAENEIAKRALARLGSLTANNPKATEAERLELARDMQKQLQRLGCYSGAIDGKWGRGSRAALKAFLRIMGRTGGVPELSEGNLALALEHVGFACSIDRKTPTSGSAKSEQKRHQIDKGRKSSRASLCRSCNTRQTPCDKRCVRNYLSNHNELILCYQRCGAYERLRACQRKYCS
jgi:tetratricopeptide (TPR) repeat protein